MASLAALKRSIAVGQEWNMTYNKEHKYYRPIGSSNEGIRPVSKVQTNSIAFRRDDGHDSWLDWPKAAEIDIADDLSSFTTLSDGIPFMYYERVI